MRLSKERALHNYVPLNTTPLTTTQERVVMVVDRLENHRRWGLMLVWVWRTSIEEKKAFNDEDHDSLTSGVEQWDWSW